MTWSSTEADTASAKSLMNLRLFRRFFILWAILWAISFLAKEHPIIFTEFGLLLMHSLLEVVPTWNQYVGYPVVDKRPYSLR